MSDKNKETLARVFEALSREPEGPDKESLHEAVRRDPRLGPVVDGLESLRRDLETLREKTGVDPPSTLEEKVLREAGPLLRQLERRAQAVSAEAMAQEAIVRGVGPSRRSLAARRQRAAPRPVPLPFSLRAAAAVLAVTMLSIAGYFVIGPEERPVVAKIQEIVGKAFLRTPDGEERADFATKEVRAGDVLFTRGEGAAFYSFQTCGDLLLGPETEVRVVEPQPDAPGACQVFELITGTISASGTSNCSLNIRAGDHHYQTRGGMIGVSRGLPRGTDLEHCEGEVVECRADGSGEKVTTGRTAEENLVSWIGALDRDRLLEPGSTDRELRDRMVGLYDDRNGGLEAPLGSMAAARNTAPAIPRPMLIVVRDSRKKSWVDELSRDDEIRTRSEDLVCVVLDLADPGNRADVESLGVTGPAVLVRCPAGLRDHGTFTEKGSRDDLLRVLGEACDFVPEWEKGYAAMKKKEMGE